MFRAIVSKPIIDHCKQQLEKYNFGQRGKADGTRIQQLVGIIGECCIRKIFNEDYIDGSSGCDDGYDIKYKGKTIDVKTMGRTTDVRDYYVNNFVGLQKDYATNYYIFNSYNKKTNFLTCIGFISKKDLLEKAKFFKEGEDRERSDGTIFKTKADLYEIDNKDLVNVNSINDLMEKLDEEIRDNI